MKNIINKFSIIIISLTVLSACNNVESNKDKNMTTHQHTEKESVYACPMHPEVTGKLGDKCPKCGMDLKVVNQENSNSYQVQLTTSSQVEAGKPAKLTLAVKYAYGIHHV